MTRFRLIRFITAIGGCISFGWFLAVSQLVAQELPSAVSSTPQQAPVLPRPE